MLLLLAYQLKSRRAEVSKIEDKEVKFRIAPRRRDGRRRYYGLLQGPSTLTIRAIGELVDMGILIDRGLGEKLLSYLPQDGKGKLNGIFHAQCRRWVKTNG